MADAKKRREPKSHSSRRGALLSAREAAALLEIKPATLYVFGQRDASWVMRPQARYVGE